MVSPPATQPAYYHRQKRDAARDTTLDERAVALTGPIRWNDVLESLLGVKRNAPKGSGERRQAIRRREDRLGGGTVP